MLGLRRQGGHGTKHVQRMRRRGSGEITQLALDSAAGGARASATPKPARTPRGFTQLLGALGAPSHWPTRSLSLNQRRRL